MRNSISLNSYGGCHGLSPVISAKIHFYVCATAWNREKFTENPYFRVQGRSRSSMLLPPESSSAVLVMTSSKSVSICNRFLARRANSGEKNDFLGGYPSLMPALERNLLIQQHKICSQETRDSTLLFWAWIDTGSWQTDRRRNRIR